jgi:hypothetical protein
MLAVCFVFGSLHTSSYESAYAKTVSSVKKSKKLRSKKRLKRKKKAKKQKKKKPFFYEASAGLGLTSVYTPTYGVSATLKGFDHYSLTIDYGSGSFDTGAFVDPEHAAQIDHALTAVGAFYYPSFKKAFYFGGLFMVEDFSVSSIATYTDTDLDAGVVTDYDIPQVTTISSMYITPAIGFYNRLFNSFYSDLKFGLSVPISSSISGSEDLSGLGIVDQDKVDETVTGERDDIINFLGGVLPYVSATIGYRVEF